MFISFLYFMANSSRFALNAPICRSSSATRPTASASPTAATASAAFRSRWMAATPTPRRRIPVAGPRAHTPHYTRARRRTRMAQPEQLLPTTVTGTARWVQGVLHNVKMCFQFWPAMVHGGSDHESERGSPVDAALIGTTFLSFLACIFVIFTYWRLPAVRRHPSGIIFWRCAFEIVFHVEVLVGAFLAPHEGGCKFFSFVSQFFILGAEVYIAILCVDLLRCARAAAAAAATAALTPHAAHTARSRTPSALHGAWATTRPLPLSRSAWRSPS